MSGQTEGMPQGDGMQDLVDMLLANQGSEVLPQFQNLVQQNGGEEFFYNYLSQQTQGVQPHQQTAQVMDFEDFPQIQPMLEVQPTGNHQLQPVQGLQPHHEAPAPQNNHLQLAQGVPPQMYQLMVPEAPVPLQNHQLQPAQGAQPQIYQQAVHEAPGPPQNYYRQQEQAPQLHSQSRRAGEQMCQYSSASSCQDLHLHPTEGVLAHQNPQQLTHQDVQPLGYLPVNPGPDQSTTVMDDIMSTIGYTDGDVVITPSIESFLNEMKDQPGMPSSDNAPPLPECTAEIMGMTPPTNPTPNLGGCPGVVGGEMTAGIVQLSSSAATRSAVPRASHALHPVNSTTPMAVVSPIANPIAPVNNSPIASRAAQPSPGPSAVPTGMAASMRNNMPHLGIHETSQDMNLVSSTREAQKGTQRGSSAAKKRTKEKTLKKKQQAKSKAKESTGRRADSKKATTSEEAQVSTTVNKNGKSSQLPEKRELRVRLYFQTYLLKEEIVSSRDGCLVYHNNPWQFPEPNLDCTGLAFPEVHVQEKEPSGHVKEKQPSGQVKEKEPVDQHMTEKQEKATKDVLAALAKGIHIFCDDDGNVYARRYCRSHVYCYSIVETEGFQPVLAPTENQPGTEHRCPKRYVRKLELNEKVMVFDNSALKHTLRVTFQTGKLPDGCYDPIVYFTFGQTWDKGFPIFNSLVYMKINPMFAKGLQDFFAKPKGDHEGDSKGDSKGDPEGDPEGDPKVNSFPCSEASLLESMSTLSMSSV